MVRPSMSGRPRQAAIAMPSQPAGRDPEGTPRCPAGACAGADRRHTPLADLTLFDYVLAESDDTARRLGPSGIERLDEHLRTTVLAYAASDLNVGATARRLHLHPNTVPYRLGRVARLTGQDLRRFAGRGRPGGCPATAVGP